MNPIILISIFGFVYIAIGAITGCCEEIKGMQFTQEQRFNWILTWPVKWGNK